MIAVIGMFGSDAFAIYAPSTGRFMQRDPVGYAGGSMNLYAYVGSNPTKYVDPYGLYKIVFDDSIGQSDRNRINAAVDSACATAKRLKKELNEARGSMSDCESDCMKEDSTVWTNFLRRCQIDVMIILQN